MYVFIFPLAQNVSVLTPLSSACVPIFSKQPYNYNGNKLTK
jgi:hypothetical protein